MIFSRARQKAASKNRKTTGRARIHSIAGLLRERRFTGKFDLAGSSYKFTYEPSKAEIADRKLRLNGRLTITDARGRERAKDNVRAVLIATQGGVGTAPIRSQALVGGVAASTAATSGQQQQLAGGAAGGGATKQGARPLPEIDSTGRLSFCGVMYFRLDPLDGRAFGVAADLSSVQLNVRLAPADATGRALHGVYCAIVDALYSKQTDARLASAGISELNKLLAVSGQ